MSQIIRRELASSKTSKKGYEKTLEDKILALQSIVGAMLIQQEKSLIEDSNEEESGN